MSVDFSTTARTSPFSAVNDRLQGLAPWLALGLVLGLAALQRLLVPANIDVAWLLTAGEKVLGGHVLYGEVLETNPPMAVGTYLPAILLSRLLGLPPETVTDTLVFVAALTSVALVAAILGGSTLRGQARPWPALLFMLAVLLILPGQNFAQREHIALIVLLPAFAVTARRAVGETPPLWAIVVAGLGAGWALSFKPHFVLGIAAAPLVAALCRRSVRPLVAPECLLAGALVALYGLATVIWLPDYFTVVLPMVRDVYLQLKRPFVELLVSTPVLVMLAMLASAARLKLGGRRDPLFLILAFASSGFAVAYLVQQKGWAYQAYPMVALALLALLDAISTRSPAADGARAISGPVPLVLGFFATWLAFNVTFRVPELQTRVAQLGPHPRVLALSGEPGVGHPLVRALKGTWVSRQQALLVHDYVGYLRPRATSPDQAALLDGYAARERANMIEDFRRTPPDVVLVDNATDRWGDWIAADPEVRALLAPYRLVATVAGVDVLKRAD
jgi:hypothetical protein